jgi:TRAP transporter 4TM/12TM fusion protein
VKEARALSTGTKIVERLTRVLAIALVLWSVIYMSHGLDYLGIIVAPDQYKASFLGIILPLAFLSYRAKKGLTRVQWYDWLLIAVAIVPNAYVFLFNDSWRLHEIVGPTTYETAFGIALTLVLLEALRRVFGIILPLVLVLFLIHPLLSSYLPGLLSGKGYSLTRVWGVIYFPPEGIFGMPLNIAGTLVIAFLVFGQFLIKSGAGETLMDLALSLVGRARGGAAKGAIVGSCLFGSLSGSSAANVAITGTFTIPLMKTSGFRPDFAGGVEASASNGGQLMPPVMGAVIFVMADFLQVPYIEICYVALIPALIYYFCMFMGIHFEACRLGLKSLPASDLPSFRNTIKAGWLYFIPILVLIYLMFGLKYTPELSSLWATVSLILVTAFRKTTRLGFQGIMDAMEGSGRSIIQVGLACAMAGIIMASLSLTGVAVLISGELVKVASGNMFILLILAAIASFIFGMGMTAIPCYIFVAIMVAPALVQMGISEMAAHFFVFWLALGSFITPPVCIAAYVASAIAQSPPMRVGLQATLIGIGIYIIPFAFIYNPAILLEGSVSEIVLTITFVLLGIVALSAGIADYLVQRAGWVKRSLLFLSAFMIFFPSWTTRVSGLGVIAAILVWQIRFRISEAKSAVSEFETTI